MKGYFPDEADAIDRYVDLVHHVNRSAQGFFGNRALPPEVADSTYEAMSGPYREYSDRTALDVLRELTANEELIAVLCGHYGDYSMTPGRAEAPGAGLRRAEGTADRRTPRPGAALLPAARGED